MKHNIPINTSLLQSLLNGIPRVPLAFKPTPLEELTNLSRQCDGPRIYAKRDDLTGLAFGGNKVRNLEFRMGEALAKNADSVIMALDVLSNSARQTTAAAVKLGMKSILVLEGDKPLHITGNLLINYLLGADIHFATTKEDQRLTIDRLVSTLEEDGCRPFVLSDSPMFALSAALAYTEATLELLAQLENLAIDLSSLHIYLSSSGKGQPGVELATRSLNLPIKVIGVSAMNTQESVHQMIAKGTNDAAKFLGLNLTVSSQNINNRTEFIGKGYGIPTNESLEAISRVAHTDALLLDPIYTGKAFAAILADIKNGSLTKNDTVVFIHTGGLPLLFSDTSILQTISTH